MSPGLVAAFCGLATLFLIPKLPVRLFNYVQFHLRYKVVKTQEEFIRIAKGRNTNSIVVDLILYPSCTYDPPLTSYVAGEWTYTLEITAEVPRGRPVVYQEFPFKRFWVSSLFADADDRGKAAMKLMLLGEKKMLELQGHFPGTSVTLNGRCGLVDRNTLAKLHRDARASGTSA